MTRMMIFLTVCSAFFVSCMGNNRDTTLYHRSGRAKPIVAVLPVINSAAESFVGWDESREMTEEIRKRVFTSPKLYLLREGGSLALAKQLNVPNPTVLSKEPLDSLGAAEFVVVAELVDEKETRYGQGPGAEKPYLEEVGGMISLAMRVRVLDVRQDKPKVILQEMLNHEQVVGRPYLKCDYEKASWGTEAYLRTPLGIAHNKMVRELVARIEGYVGASKG